MAIFENLRSLLGSSGMGSLGAHLTSWNTDFERKEGERLLEESDYIGAELHLAQAILEGERRQESADQRILLRLELAEAQRRQYEIGGDPQKLVDAEKTVRSALELASRTSDRELLTQTLDASVTIAAGRGNLEEVERLMQALNALESKGKRRDPMQRALRLHRLGLLQQQHGQLQEAVESLAESVAIHEQILGHSDLSTARLLGDLGRAHHASGNHPGAQQCLRRAIRIHEEHGQIVSLEAASDLQALTASLEESGDIDGAATEFERALALKSRMVGQDLDAVAEEQFELARHYLRWQRPPRARELLMEALGTFKRTGGASLARTYETLAQLERDTGHYQEALRQLKRAGSVWGSVSPQHVTERIRNLEQQIALFDELHRHEETAFLRGQLAALKQAVCYAEAS